MATEHIKIERWQLVEHLLSSLRDHYEMMSDEDLIAEYREYISEDPNYDVVITVKEENEDE
jgi:hypothetical protein